MSGIDFYLEVATDRINMDFISINKKVNTVRMIMLGKGDPIGDTHLVFYKSGSMTMIWNNHSI